MLNQQTIPEQNVATKTIAQANGCDVTFHTVMGRGAVDMSDCLTVYQPSTHYTPLAGRPRKRAVNQSLTRA